MSIRILVIAALVALSGSHVAAAPFNDPGEFARVGFGGTISGLSDPLIGGTATLDGGGTIFVDLLNPTEEFGGLLAVSLALADLAFSAGPSNDGRTFDASYNRSFVTDPAGGNAPGSQTGDLTFTVTGTEYAFTHSDPTGASTFGIGFMISVFDSAGFHDMTVGSLAVTGFLTGENAGTARFVLSIPEALPGFGVVPLPAGVLLLLTALAGLGVAARGRPAA